MLLCESLLVFIKSSLCHPLFQIERFEALQCVNFLLVDDRSLFTSEFHAHFVVVLGSVPGIRKITGRIIGLWIWRRFLGHCCITIGTAESFLRMEYWFRRAHLRNTGDVSGHPVFFSAVGMVMRWSNVIYSLSPPVQISERMTRTSVNHIHHIQLFKVFTYLQFKHDATQRMCSDFYRRRSALIKQEQHQFNVLMKAKKLQLQCENVRWFRFYFFGLNFLIT